MLTLPMLLMAGCGGSEQPEAKEAPAQTSMPRSGDLAVPINEAPTPTPSPSKPRQANKPLVSSETSSSKPPPPLQPHADSYGAMGTEPFWAATVRGSQVTLETPNGDPQNFSVRRQDEARAIRFAGDGFTMTVTPGPCSDGMSNALWSDRVQIAYAGGTLKGCGGEREDMEEPPPNDY